MAQKTDMSNSMGKDVSDIGNAAKKTVTAVRDAADTAKTVGKAAAEAASGNFVGAGITLVKKSKILSTILTIALFLAFLVIVVPVVFLMALPGTIFGGALVACENAGSAWQDALGWFEGEWAELVNPELRNSVVQEYDKIARSDATVEYWSDELTESNTAGVTVESDPGEIKYWSLTNIKVSVLSNYFKASYENALTRAQNKAMNEEEGNSIHWKQYCVDNGKAESADYVHFSQSIGTETTADAFMEPAFYIIATDSWANTNNMNSTSNDTSRDSGADRTTFSLTRMMRFAKQLAPNRYIDWATTELQVGLNRIGLGAGNDKNMFWILDVNVDVGESYTEYESVPPIIDHSEDYLESDGITVNHDGDVEIPQEPIPHKAVNVNVSYSVKLNGNIKEKIYDKYNVPSNERAEHISDAMTSTDIQTFNEQISSSSYSVVDLIMMNVNRLKQIYPNWQFGRTPTPALSPLDEQAIQNLLARLEGLEGLPAQIAAVAAEIAGADDPTAMAAKLNIRVEGGFCQRFVADLMRVACGTRPSYGSANDAYNALSQTGHISQGRPPDGSFVFADSTSAPLYGHVGIYVGGYVIDCIDSGNGGIVQVQSFEEWCSQGWISRYKGWSPVE